MISNSVWCVVAALLATLGTTSPASATVTGLEVEYNGLVGGRHVWSVYAVSTNAQNVILNVIDHTVIAGSMSGVQHNDTGVGSWSPLSTQTADHLANDSFVTVTGNPGSGTSLAPGFVPSTGPVIPTGAGWFSSNHAVSPIRFTGGRIKIIQVAIGNSNGVFDGYSARLDVGYLTNSSSTVPLIAESLTYTVGVPCSRQVASTSPQLVPYSFSNPREWTATDIPPSSEGATLTVTARGQLGSSTRFLTVKIDGVTLATNVFGSGSGAGVCTGSPSVLSVPISAAQFSKLTADGQLKVRIEPSLNATSDGCSTAQLQVSLDYPRDVTDCNADGIDDICLMASNRSEFDCNGNRVLDSCEIASGSAADVNGNGQPDGCEADCNVNNLPDAYEIAQGLAPDCNQNSVPDSCDIATGGSSSDVDANGIPDDCKADCNSNSLPDAYEIAQSLVADCDNNAVPDVCQIAGNSQLDCDGNQHLDSCQIATDPSLDCDQSGLVDTCQIAANPLLDCNEDGVLDSCQGGPGGSDCDGNGTADVCEIANGAEDKNSNGRLDLCELRFGDLNLDGQINGTDLAGLLAVWGLPSPPYGDLDGDGQVGGTDLAFLLARWGPVP